MNPSFAPLPAALLPAIAPLFSGWQETLLYSCLEGRMGHAYAMGEPPFAAAQIIVGDFCFFAGVPNEALVQHFPAQRTAQQTGLIVLEDGINSLLRTQRPAPIAALAPEQTVYLASLSKVLLPGLRLAYLSAPPHLAAPLQTALYNLNLTQSGLLLELASRLIFSGRADTLITTRRKRAAARNRLADELLAGYTLLGPPTCLSRWLLLPGRCTGYKFEQRALAHGVAVYGAERFAVGKNPPPAAVRLAITAPETSAQLAGALHTLRGLLDQL